MPKFIYRPTNNAKQYSSKSRKLSDIKFIVIHDTGNPTPGAGALGHLKYLNGATRQGSAHYYVDQDYIAQPVGDSKVAWAVGDTWAKKNATRRDVTNYNSLSIEMCINKDGDYRKMYKNVVELTKNLMALYKIPPGNVVRHFDASGKPCPDHMRSNGWLKWQQFKKDIQGPIEWRIDLSKDSEFGPSVKTRNVTQAEVTDVEDLAAQDDKRKEYLMNKKIDPDNLPTWAEKEWEEAKELGITDGTRPGATATRAEVAAMIMRAIKEAKSGKCNCHDNGGVGYRTGL